MRYQIEHVTEYTYESAAAQCLTEAHLIPRETTCQTVIDSFVEVDPEPVEAGRRTEYFGNWVDLFSILQSHERLNVTSRSVVEIKSRRAAACAVTWEDAVTALAEYKDEQTLEALQYVFDSPFVAASPGLREYGAFTFTPGRPLQQPAIELCARIHRDFCHKSKSTSIDKPLYQVLDRREGVCQDFAHVMIGVLRS